MSKEKIIELAREAGLSDLVDYNRRMHPDCFVGKWDDLVKLYQMVAASEREALEKIDWTALMRKDGLVTWNDADTLGDRVIEAIRARGQQ